jgi:hypothetical protein
MEFIRRGGHSEIFLTLNGGEKGLSQFVEKGAEVCAKT